MITLFKPTSTSFGSVKGLMKKARLVCQSCGARFTVPNHEDDLEFATCPECTFKTEMARKIADSLDPNPDFLEDPEFSTRSVFRGRCYWS